MGFGLYSLLESFVLVLNAVCILHEERFLAKGNMINVLLGEKNNFFINKLIDYFCM